MQYIVKSTNPRITTRIKGQVPVGNWMAAMSQKQTTTTENCTFGEAYYEEDSLLDTGCSYAAVSKDWLFGYCLKNHLDVGSVLIPHPDEYEVPGATTAKEGSVVKWIGFAKIKLSCHNSQKKARRV